MRQKRFTSLQLIVAALGGAVLTALVLLAVLWTLLGKQGLSFLEAWGAVRTQFVGDFDLDGAADSALSGLAAGLGDRWSYYLNAEEYQAQSQRRDNTYVGIGIIVGYDDPRGLLIQSVMPEGPADKAGLKAGEVIAAVDGTDTSGERQNDGLDAIQGEAGTEVALTVLDEDGRSREVVLTRAEVENRSVRSELLENGVGYVDVDNFYSHSADQLIAAVDGLVEQGARALVFDMRDNGGGYVKQLTDMLDHLLPEGPIFRSQSKEGVEKVTTADENYVNLPMAVLVNENTYSAAELFAAQLQETAGAAIVGTGTSGKGYSQQAIPLPNGGALNLSTARYTTGMGVSLVGTGVTLDAEVDLSEEDAYALQMGRLDHADDAQLQKALEFLEESPHSLP